MNQIDSLYLNIQSAKRTEFELQAKLHGFKIEGGSKTSSNADSDVRQEDPNVPMFGDPTEYEHLSTEKREELTQRMMGKHKVWSGESLNVPATPKKTAH